MSDNPSLTRAVCAFASDLRLSRIPSHVLHKVKLHILDALGCGIAGSQTQLGQDVIRFASLEASSGVVPILGTGRALGPAAAAFANSGCMNALDCDDGVEIAGAGMGHPGASIIAAALSSSCSDNSPSGERFLEAIVAAYEVNNRLIYSIQPSIERFQVVYGVCQHQSVSSGVAAGLLLGIEGAELENVVGLAGTLSNVPSLRKYNFKSRPIVTLKDFNAPAAETGVRATQLHELGFRGATDVLDGESGLWRMLGSDEFHPERLVGGLGSEWLTLRSTLKAYPVCRWMHTCMEAFETVLAGFSIAASEIEEVTVKGSAILLEDFMVYRPETMVDAQFSIPYAFASLASGIAPFTEWYAAENLRSDSLLKLADRVKAVLDPEIDQLMRESRRPAGRVLVRARGQTFESDLFIYAMGSPERPLTDDAITAKFLSNASPVVGEAHARSILIRVMGMETEKRAAGVFAEACQA